MGMDERRQFLRVDAAVAVHYRLRESPERHLTTTVDVGGGGVCLLVPEPLPRGAYVEVELTLPGEPRAIPFTAQVAWCDPAPPPGKTRCRAGLEILFIARQEHDRLSRYCLKKLGGLPPRPPDAPGV
ncbi:MAG: PilZ domain-containing protein [Candidatus Omnitrophica bacterium]|nr:PilZ domain-containing protein [Candidatus Omnitrophota bacterium]